MRVLVQACLGLSLFQLCIALELMCPSKLDTDVTAKLSVGDPNGSPFNEISGISLSLTQKAPSGYPVMYAVNDFGGRGKRLGVFDSGTGDRLLSLRLPVPSAFDWESLAIGSCGIHGETSQCVYIADTGDNDARQSGGGQSRRFGLPYRIFKVLEPDLDLFNDNDEVPESNTWVLEYNYLHPSSPTNYSDCEAIFLDHTGWGGRIGDLYVVTKWDEGHRDKTRLFHIAARAWTTKHAKIAYSPPAVGNYSGDGELTENTWTMADMSLDGTLIALGMVGQTFLFGRCPGVSVSKALTGDAGPCHVWQNPTTNKEKKFESFAWQPDAKRSLQVSECVECNPRLSWTTLDYVNGSKILECPEFFKPSQSPTPMPSPGPTQAPTLGATETPTTAPLTETMGTESPTASPASNDTLPHIAAGAAQHDCPSAANRSFQRFLPAGVVFASLLLMPQM